jgi:hypothetical protein
MNTTVVLVTAVLTVTAVLLVQYVRNQYKEVEEKCEQCKSACKCEKAAAPKAAEGYTDAQVEQAIAELSRKVKQA